MSNPLRIPTGVERLALLDTLSYGIMIVRNWSIEMSWQQISHVMGAVHNIPFYLQTYEEHYWDAILWDLESADLQLYDLPFDGNLLGVYEPSKLRHEESLDCSASTMKN